MTRRARRVSPGCSSPVRPQEPSRQGVGRGPDRRRGTFRSLGNIPAGVTWVAVIVAVPSGYRDGVVCAQHGDVSISATPSEAIATPGGPHAADSLRPFFEPRTVAVIGAGRSRGSVGAEIFHNLIAGGFRGTTIPVNPHAAAVESVRAYRTVRDVECSIDLAIIAVPADGVDGVLDDCIATHIPAVILISAGFSETGEGGRRREQACATRCGPPACGLIGPNCMGLVEHRPRASPERDVRAGVSAGGSRSPFSSQSGALGTRGPGTRRSSDSGCRASSRWATRPMCRPTTDRVLGERSAHVASSCCTWRASGIHGSSATHRAARRAQQADVALKAGRSARSAAASSHTGALAAKRRYRGRALPARLASSAPKRWKRCSTCRAALAPAAPGRQTGRDPDQRGRPRHPGGRCVRGARSGCAGTSRSHGRTLAHVSAGRRERVQSD